MAVSLVSRSRRGFVAWASAAVAPGVASPAWVGEVADTRSGTPQGTYPASRGAPPSCTWRTRSSPRRGMDGDRDSGHGHSYPVTATDIPLTKARALLVNDRGADRDPTQPRGGGSESMVTTLRGYERWWPS